MKAKENKKMEGLGIEGLYEKILKAQKSNSEPYQRRYDEDRSLRLSQVGKKEDKKVGNLKS